MKPIETVYKGIRFRSRLEARWAVFFDCLGIEWRFEPDVFTLCKLGKYVPDFYLPQIGCYGEVKPEWPTKLETDKMRGTGLCLLLVAAPSTHYYWKLTADDEIAFVFQRGGIRDMEPEEAPIYPEQFAVDYQKAVERAQRARFDGYDEDRWRSEDRYA